MEKKPTAKDVTLALARAEERCCTILVALNAAVSRAAEALQSSPRVFVGEAERRAAYATVCRLLVSLESHMLELRHAIVAISSFQLEILRSLSSSAKDSARLRADADRTEAMWRSFYESRVVAFSECMEAAADMAHDGSACDPIAASRLCVAFCEAAERQLGEAKVLARQR